MTALAGPERKPLSEHGPRKTSGVQLCTAGTKRRNRPLGLHDKNGVRKSIGRDKGNIRERLGHEEQHGRLLRKALEPMFLPARWLTKGTVKPRSNLAKTFSRRRRQARLGRLGANPGKVNVDCN